jgi:mannose-6-phosphate isomerase-like protein (cupin superfamily)
LIGPSFEGGAILQRQGVSAFETVCGMKDMSPSPVVPLESLSSVLCPCGEAKRAFGDRIGAVASVHLVEIHTEAKLHFHRRMTEIYVVLEGTGEIELDGVRYALAPLTAVYISPGVKHRAIGRMRVLNIPVPAFDPADEWVEEQPGTGEFCLSRPSGQVS